MRTAVFVLLVQSISWFHLVTPLSAEPTISSTLQFMKMRPSFISAGKKAGDTANTPVTLRFSEPPASALLDELERHGVSFNRFDGAILHSSTVYPAVVHLDSLNALARYDEIVRIEGTHRPGAAPTLDVSSPQVQAYEAQQTKIPGDGFIDGSGVIVTNVDTGIDIYHPAFFKPDNGRYDWIDTDENGAFNNGDAVDLDHDGVADPLEVLRYFDADFTDPYELMTHEEGVYETDIDWLYNDKNRDNRRNFGLSAGFSETDPCFGELMFLTDDANGNLRLDPGEQLIGLGTSRIRAVYDEKGEHYRGENLFTAVADITDHGTPACGIVGGQIPGRRLVGMAPGVEFICINRHSLSNLAEERDDLYFSIEAGLLWARKLGSKIMMYEYGSWVYEFLDGSSNMETLISELYAGDAEHDPVHQFTASGNLAGPTRKKHAFLSPGKNEQLQLPFSAPAMNPGISELYISLLWQGRFNSPTITLTQGTSSLTLDIIVGAGQNSQPQSGMLGQYEVMWVTEESERNTVKLDINLAATDDNEITGDIRFDITGNRLAATDIDAYLSDNVTSWMHGAQFTAYVNDDGTVTTPGTADNSVTVGAYDPRGRRNGEGVLNDFSSWGDTIDGRRGVDIVAPGSDVYSVSSHYKQGGEPGGYLAFGGTSSALPHVAGCAALILQAAPDITPPMLEQVLYSGAYVDEHTGTVIPNDRWGYGKLRIFDALMNAGLTVAAEDESPSPPPFTVSNAFPNPFNNTTSFSIDYTGDMESPIAISVYSLSGQRIAHREFRVSSPGAIMFNWEGVTDDGQTASSGVYLFRFTAGTASVTKRAVFLK